MEEQLQIIEIGNYDNFSENILSKKYKNVKSSKIDLKYDVDKMIDKIKFYISKDDILLFSGNEENLSKIIEICQFFSSSISVISLEENLFLKNKELLLNSIDAIFPVLKKVDTFNVIENLIILINRTLERGIINLDITDIKFTLKDIGLSSISTINIANDELSNLTEKEIIKNIKFPFYNNIENDIKKILFSLYVDKNFKLRESNKIAQSYIELLETKKKENRVEDTHEIIDDIMFSINVDKKIKNKVEVIAILGGCSDN